MAALILINNNFNVKRRKKYIDLEKKFYTQNLVSTDETSKRFGHGREKRNRRSPMGDWVEKSLLEVVQTPIHRQAELALVSGLV